MGLPEKSFFFFPASKYRKFVTSNWRSCSFTKIHQFCTCHQCKEHARKELYSVDPNQFLLQQEKQCPISNMALQHRLCNFRVYRYTAITSKRCVYAVIIQKYIVYAIRYSLYAIDHLTFVVVLSALCCFCWYIKCILLQTARQKHHWFTQADQVLLL